MYPCGYYSDFLESELERREHHQDCLVRTEYLVEMELDVLDTEEVMNAT